MREERDGEEERDSESAKVRVREGERWGERGRERVGEGERGRKSYS